MPCYHPLEAFWKLGGGITFEHRYSNGNPVKLPCGRCVGCRVDHGQMWSTRMQHEALFHADCCFLTLTYRDEDLPCDLGLRKRHLQQFIRDLRNHLRHAGKIRYYGCGEYGDESLRPHYHLIVFGYYPADTSTIDGKGRGTSATIERLWGRGYCTVGPATPETMAYTARYVQKKLNGPAAAGAYERLHRDTGEIVTVIPPFALMSRNPGIGARYYAEYGHQLHAEDCIRLKGGSKVKTPRYYDRLLEKQDPATLEARKLQRRENAKLFKADQTPARLAVRETCAAARQGQRQRAN